jgi:ATP-binding protein involved in chromosome partitioning
MTTPTERLQAALSELSEPESHQALGKLGMLKHVEVDADGLARVTLRLTKPSYPPKRELGTAVEKLARSIEGIENARVSWEFEPLGRAVTPDDAVPAVKNVVLVMSGKGGVGKSTVAANLALALRRLGARVGLLDADIHGPSIPTMLGMPERITTDGEKLVPPVLHGIRLMSIGYLLEDPKTAVIWRGPMLHSALVQFLRDVAWNELDYLLMDLPPGTGDIALTLSQRVRCNGAVVVTTPQKLALQDVYKTVTMSQKLGIEILGVVENQSYFECDHGQRYELFGSGGGREVAQLAAAPLLGQIPIHPAVRESGDSGMPLVEADPTAPVSKVFMGIAEALAEQIAKLNARSGGRLGTIRDEEGRPHLPVMR